MKTKDQQLLEEAYKSIHESTHQSSSAITPEIEEMYWKAFNNYEQGKMSPNQWGDVCAKLLADIMMVHSVPDRDISEEEDEQMIAYDKMSDNELLELYKSEYDKLFDGENPEQQQKIITQIYSAIKDRGNALASSASKYADYKRESER